MATAANAPLRADADAIEMFLRSSIGTSIHLACITPDGPISYHHFGDSATEAASWAAAENMRGRGVYWTVNTVRDGFHGKPKKGDIADARFIHVDIDPPKNGAGFDKLAIIDQLCALRFEPSFVIDTGNGLGAFWRLEETSSNLPAIESINTGLRDLFDADNCHNIDRLMRLPGTVNWPNKSKSALGRQPRLATVMVEDQGTFFDPWALAAEFPILRKVDAERPTIDVAGPCALLTADELGLSTLHPLRSLIEHPQGRDRSGDALACAGRMVRDGFTDLQILGVLINPANAVHAHIGDQRDPRYQALRCIEKARAPQDPFVQHGASVAAGLGFAAGREQDAAAGEPLPGGSGPDEWDGTKSPDRRFILDGWLVRGSAGLLGGEDGVGKSLLGQQMATCAAAQVAFLGLPMESVRTLYVTCEDSTDELQRRQESINAALGVNMAELKGKLKTYSLKGHLGNELATFDQSGVMRPTNRYQQLKKAALDFGANLVFVDNAAHVFAGNENARHDVASFLGLLEQLSDAIDGAVVLLAHPNKQHSQGNKKGNEYSGSTGWSAHVRNRLFLDWKNNEDGAPGDARRRAA